jgi:MerR family transcriptional regulator, copper efflux regulator
MNGLSIGKLAKSANVSIDTIRFYEKSGLLQPPTRRPSGFREYSEAELRRLRFIRLARMLGLSLDEIAGLLSLDASQPPEERAPKVEQQLRMIDWRIEQLRQWRDSLLEMSRGTDACAGSILDAGAETSAPCAQAL